jgi:hypothetical protein
MVKEVSIVVEQRVIGDSKRTGSCACKWLISVTGCSLSGGRAVSLLGALHH